MNALTISQPTPPIVADGCCVLTVDQPPPCPLCNGSRTSCPPFTRQMCRNDGVAPWGTEVLVWNPAGWSCSICGPNPGSSSGWCDSGCGSDYYQMAETGVAGVVLAGKLVEVDMWNERAPLPPTADPSVTYDIALSDVVVLSPSITEWDGGIPPQGSNHVRTECSVEMIESGWAVCPQALLDTVKAREGT